MPFNLSRKLIVIIILSIALISAGGYLYYRNTFPSSSENSTQSPTQYVAVTEQINNLTATINGQITNIEGRTLTIKDQQGKIASYTLAPNALITKTDEDNNTRHTDSITEIELNKDVLAVVELKNNTYYVKSIVYTKPAPSAPKLDEIEVVN